MADANSTSNPMNSTFSATRTGSENDMIRTMARGGSMLLRFCAADTTLAARSI